MKEFVEKLIERLEKLQEKYKGIRANTHCVVTETSECDSCKADNYLYARLRCVDEVIKIINQLAEEYNQDSTKNNQGWILCSERLPEEPDIQFQALEYFPEYNVTIAGAEQSTTLNYLGAGEWSDTEGNSYNVIAWQQLPKAYRPEEEHEKKVVRTRIEHIHSMSVEEMADKIMENEELYVALKFCRNYAKCWEEVDEDECKKCLIKWLNSPVEQQKVIPTKHFEDRFNTVT